MAKTSKAAASGKKADSKMDSKLRTPMSSSMTKGAKPVNPKAMAGKKK